MTMIAGFKINEVPFLIGDFVISKSGERSELRKKLVWLSKNCAVTWTGSLLTADLVLKQLFDRFYETRISREALVEFLSCVEETPNYHIRMIFCLVEEAPSFFLWNSGYPVEVYDYDDLVTDGSGASVIEPHIRYYQRQFTGADPKNVHHWGMAVFTATLSQEALADETTTYGFSYEMIFYYRGEFWPLQFICFAHIGIGFSEGEQLAILGQSGPLHIYNSMGNQGAPNLSLVNVLHEDGRRETFGISAPGMNKVQREEIDKIKVEIFGIPEEAEAFLKFLLDHILFYCVVYTVQVAEDPRTLTGCFLHSRVPAPGSGIAVRVQVDEGLPHLQIETTPDFPDKALANWKQYFAERA